MKNSSDSGAFLPGLLIVLSSWGVILWAILSVWPDPEPTVPSLGDCIRSGHVETPQGPVFCTLVAERKD